MRVLRHGSVGGFLERAGGFLEEREAEHNLILGLCATLARDQHAFGAADPYLATVEHRGRVVAAALRTPPHNLVLSEIDDVHLCAVLATDAAEVDGSLTGLLASPVAAEAFTREWKRLTGKAARRSRSQRIYRAGRPRNPRGSRARCARTGTWIARSRSPG